MHRWLYIHRNFATIGNVYGDSAFLNVSSQQTQWLVGTPPTPQIYETKVMIFSLAPIKPLNNASLVSCHQSLHVGPRAAHGNTSLIIKYLSNPLSAKSECLVHQIYVTKLMIFPVVLI